MNYSSYWCLFKLIRSCLKLLLKKQSSHKLRFSIRIIQIFELLIELLWPFTILTYPNLDPRTFFLLFEFMTTQRCHFIKKHERTLGTRMGNSIFFLLILFYHGFNFDTHRILGNFNKALSNYSFGIHKRSFVKHNHSSKQEVQQFTFSKSPSPRRAFWIVSFELSVT